MIHLLTSAKETQNMRKLLLLALLLYDIAEGNKINNALDSYEEVNTKRHSSDDIKRHTEDRRSWRKQTLAKTDENWDDTEKNLNDHEYYDRGHKHEYEKPERIVPVRNRKRSYTDTDAPEGHFDNDVDGARRSPKTSSLEKGVEKKDTLALSCNREHERYEACFAGCAAVTCDNPRDRLRPCYPFCEPGCVCEPPRVRDDRTHKCVLPDQCTKGLKGIPDLGMNVEVRTR